MHLSIVGLFLLKVIGLASSTCVLESEFGFILNCNFKKSGLFRVRNLGGLKAHFGLGFSLGDELGFPESLGNLEGNRRRALNYKTGFSNKVGVLSPRIDTSTKAPQRHYVRNVNQMNSSMTEVMFLPLGVPTFRPIPKTGSNSVRRTDVLLTDGEEDNRVTNMNFIPKYDNVTNHLSKTDNMNYFAAVNELKNVSSNMENKMKNNALSSSINSLQGQDLSQIEFDNTKHATKMQSIKLNKKISGKDSKTTMVMNAPKEYYPSGYDKNFDDNFKSKVGLPLTDFTCAEQKYFPGLYANIQLGCMVFHVCAITDDGMVMKSFLCPESTLFDQSILKCNWWFYVDCNNSSYDSNIPISKTYQLMKSLAYFSNFTSNSSLGTVESKKL